MSGEYKKHAQCKYIALNYQGFTTYTEYKKMEREGLGAPKQLSPVNKLLNKIGGGLWVNIPYRNYDAQIFVNEQGDSVIIVRFDSNM